MFSVHFIFFFFFFEVERRMAEKKEAVATLFELLVEITNLFLCGRGSYACFVVGMRLEGEEAEAVTQFTGTMDYF